MNATLRKLYTPIAAAIISIGGIGCATTSTTPTATEIQTAALQTRLDESERLNGRITVRIEELEDQVFLLQDRVEANRIALQRRGIFGKNRTVAQNDAPPPTPETYYAPSAPSYEEKPVQQKPVRRIKLHNPNYYNEYQDQQPVAEVPVTVDRSSSKRTDEAEVVISEEEFDAFARKFDSNTPAPAARKSGTRRVRTPQPDVTSEKLPTTSQLKSGEKPKAAPPSSKKGLALYKDALAAYRAADYGNALTHFEAFLAGGPKEDYVDNALYWIGECYFGIGDMDKAVAYFRRVLNEQPSGNKVPDSLLKMSKAYDRLGQKDKATSLLKRLTTEYSGTNAGKLGAKQLQARQ